MDNTDIQPWWKFGHVWLVISGPAIVVVAAFITLYLAIRMPDPVLPPDGTEKAVTTGKGAAAAEPGMVPAQQARNHAATGGAPAAPSAAARR